MSTYPSHKNAFTLVELAIVLVIIGLIVGGVLVGRDLVSTSEVNATLAQVQRFNTSRSAFRLKYNALPGDMTNAIANQFGFTPRGVYAGEGDGNGLMEGNCQGNYNAGNYIGCGESVMYWVDLTSANGLNLNMIEGNFNTATPGTNPGTITTGLDAYFPQAKVGKGNMFHVWSGGVQTQEFTGYNFYGLSVPTDITNGWNFRSANGLTVQQAYDMDQKIDDGMPQTGTVIAMYIHGGAYHWANGGNNTGASTVATANQVAYCFNNNNVAGAVQQYSINNTANAGKLNCGLSFKFQ